MSIAMDSLKNGDHVILYVSPFSGIGINSEHIGDFLECYIVNIMKNITGDQNDDRVLICCSQDLREEHHPKMHMYSDQVLVSAKSPFIMSWDEYKGCKYDPDYLDHWLTVVGDAICYDEELCDNHYPEEIILDLSQAFHTEHREAICFPK